MAVAVLDPPAEYQGVGSSFNLMLKVLTKSVDLPKSWMLIVPTCCGKEFAGKLAGGKTKRRSIEHSGEKTKMVLSFRISARCSLGDSLFHWEGKCCTEYLWTCLKIIVSKQEKVKVLDHTKGRLTFQSYGHRSHITSVIMFCMPQGWQQLWRPGISGNIW